jgi:hypothetical protein
LSEGLRTGGEQAIRALPFNWKRFGFRDIVDDTKDQVEKSAGKYPPFLIQDWLYRLATFKLRYSHWRKTKSRKHASKDLTAWMLGEELFGLLIHMKCPKSAPLAIHKAITEAKENQKQSRLYAQGSKKPSQKQKSTWRQVEATVITEVNKAAAASFKKNDFRPPGDGKVPAPTGDKGGQNSNGKKKKKDG